MSGSDHSFIPSEYGQSGKTNFDGFGYGVNAGVEYKTSSLITLGLEYRYSKVDVNADQFRSFLHNGAKSNLTTSKVFFTIGKQF